MGEGGRILLEYPGCDENVDLCNFVHLTEVQSRGCCLFCFFFSLSLSLQAVGVFQDTWNDRGGAMIWSENRVHIWIWWPQMNQIQADQPISYLKTVSFLSHFHARSRSFSNYRVLTTSLHSQLRSRAKTQTVFQSNLLFSKRWEEKIAFSCRWHGRQISNLISFMSSWLGRYRFLIFKSRARYHLEELREARNDAGENLSVQLKYWIWW